MVQSNREASYREYEKIRAGSEERGKGWSGGVAEPIQ